ncbi:MAG: GreA/GreB family elongation factor [Kiritimatiellae bacterium]|nr:GreA/GreB family elongation factor [Kiritimatiellia bacterium]
MADTEAVVVQLGECAEKQDFGVAFSLVKENMAALAKKIRPEGIRDALKKTTKDRLLLSFLDGVDFGVSQLDESLVRLEKLLSFQQGALVLNDTWGLGVVKRLDYFYRRITVDFKTRKGHQFTYAAATDMLERAPDNHILVLRQSDPARVEAMLRDQPGEFVKAVLKSYGDMPIVKLEDVCVSNGFVKAVNWKAFWEKARVELRKDSLVAIPVKRTDPIQLKESAEDYGDSWLTAFSHETDPKLILAAVREYVAQGKFKAVDDASKAKIEERLVFAVTAARKVDDALYARLACLVRDLGFANPPAGEMRDYLWERKRFVKAAATLPAREVGAMVSFLAVDEESKARLYKAIPEMCFTAVSEVVAQFGGESACREAVAEFMRQPKAPATLVTLIVGKYEGFKDWSELPPLITILTHAIALGEGRQGGETLKMQNIVRRLFADTKWLEKVYSWLDEGDQALFFERFQASIAWDPSTHHTIVVRMTRIVPALEAHVVKVEKKKEYARVTSYRSFALKKAEYLKLINEDMPANIKRIEFAKSYGDLSENAEYQYAKDEQRALMQKQTLMQQDLETVKPDDFADASVEEVMPGVSVLISTPDGERTYHVLGEWDNDTELGVLSSKARLAQNMLGKKAGEEFELPGSDGATQFARIVQIMPLPTEIRDWMKLPDGMQI